MAPFFLVTGLVVPTLAPTWLSSLFLVPNLMMTDNFFMAALTGECSAAADGNFNKMLIFSVPGAIWAE
jgi:hypothetical protein